MLQLPHACSVSSKYSPVYNLMVMEELQTQDYAGWVEPVHYTKGSRQSRKSSLLYSNSSVNPGRSTHTARGSANTSACMCIIRSPPAVYSMTKHTCSGVWKHANRLTRKGWWELLTVSKIRFSHIRLEAEGRGRRARWIGGLWCSRSVALIIIKHSYLSTSSLATISPFFRALMAYWLPVFLYSDSNTWREQVKISRMKLQWDDVMQTLKEDAWDWGPYLPKVAPAKNSNQLEVL